RYLLNATILGVMAQRLLRTLCPHCKTQVPYGDDRAADLGWEDLVSPWKARRPDYVYSPVGCLECRMTGYRGRLGIYEVMMMSPAIRRLVCRSGYRQNPRAGVQGGNEKSPCQRSDEG